MTAAAIAAQLVDIKNDPQHKGSIRVTIHVPVEQGAELTAAFGWPTMVTPVPVALARLNLNAGEGLPPVREADKPARAPASRLTQQAGICCNDHLFRQFLGENGMLAGNPVEAAACVRMICGRGPNAPLESRREIIPGSDAGKKWEDLYSKFIQWRDMPDAA